MTRINVVPPEELCDQHLLAEFRELTRTPNLVARELSGQQRSPTWAVGLPVDYVLGTGHVRFFYDRLAFLRRRHLALMTELKARGFKAESRWPEQMPYLPEFWKGYEPTANALRINRERIEESKARMKSRPRYTERKPVAPRKPIDVAQWPCAKRFTVGEPA